MDWTNVTSNLLQRLWREEVGQDLVEYAFLGAFIGLAAYGGFVAVQNAISTSYPTWDNCQQGLWEPPDPGAGVTPGC
jgi:Flp pilus assembly pilin Flp